jgi:hypothetical protein
MVENGPVEFAMPGSSWEMLKRIIKAYYAAHEDKQSTVESIAKLGGISRPVISLNNNFLRSIGMVEQNEYKLTPVGVRLAIGLARKTTSVVTGALNEIVDKTDKLKKIVKTVQARGTMDEAALKVEMMLVLGLNENSRGFPFLRTLMDLLYESGILLERDGKVSFHGFYVEEIKGATDSLLDHRQPSPPREEQGDSQPASTESRKVPIALGAERRAYLELPDDWEPKDLRKLLKMIELALGEETEG